MTIPPRVLAIMIEVSERHGVSLEGLLGPSKKRPIYRARCEAIRAVGALETFHGHHSPFQIGRWFNRDRTTVLNVLGRLSPKYRALRPSDARAA